MDPSNHPDYSSNNTQVCGSDALTSSYGWIIQGILATLVFGLLVVKRFCEPVNHRRSWLVWFYDTSKQGFGSIIVHFANVFLAEYFIGDPCTWYIVSFLLDSTLGLLIVWVGIRLSIHIGRTKGMPTLLFGEYGCPPSIHAWGHQCLIYILILFIEKVIITVLMAFPIWSGVRDLILSPFHDPKVEVVFAVVIIPFFVNALIFWVTDNFLMLKYKSKDSSLGSSPIIISSYKKENKSSSDSKVCLKLVTSSSDEECNGLLSSSSNDDELLGMNEDLKGATDVRSDLRHIDV
ncbi:UNVERIFIED_CONTAM: hypothetical protein RMT77_009669 [Armadillidium vulgare]